MKIKEKKEKKGYVIFVYSQNPTYHDQKEGSQESDYKFYAKTKREVVGLMKTIVDNFDVEHIAVHKEREVQ